MVSKFLLVVFCDSLSELIPDFHDLESSAVSDHHHSAMGEAVPTFHNGRGCTVIQQLEFQHIIQN